MSDESPHLDYEWSPDQDTIDRCSRCSRCIYEPMQKMLLHNKELAERANNEYELNIITLISQTYDYIGQKISTNYKKDGWTKARIKVVQIAKTIQNHVKARSYNILLDQLKHYKQSDQYDQYKYIYAVTQMIHNNLKPDNASELYGKAKLALEKILEVKNNPSILDIFDISNPQDYVKPAIDVAVADPTRDDNENPAADENATYKDALDKDLLDNQREYVAGGAKDDLMDYFRINSQSRGAEMTHKRNKHNKRNKHQKYSKHLVRSNRRINNRSSLMHKRNKRSAYKHNYGMSISKKKYKQTHTRKRKYRKH